jgi:hypothetical protein
MLVQDFYQMVVLPSPGGQTTTLRNSIGNHSRDLRYSKGQIIGNRNSKVYHRPDCLDYQKVSERNRVYFSTAIEAEKVGFGVPVTFTLILCRR